MQILATPVNLGMNLSLERDSSYRNSPAYKAQRRRMGLGGTEQEGIALRSEGTKEDAFHEDVEVDLIGVRLYTPLKQQLRLLKY